MGGRVGGWIQLNSTQVETAGRWEGDFIRIEFNYPDLPCLPLPRAGVCGLVGGWGGREGGWVGGKWDGWVTGVVRRVGS